MSTPAFTSAETDRVAPDPSKHVHYTQGMVLGVDDFTQEFAYLDNRDQWLAREAIGYGTITGLHVNSRLKDGAHDISVSPGVAISPRGQLIRVAAAQCAKIEAWLQLETTQAQLTERAIGPNSAFNAYVVLCYRDCPVDELPVPGEPCRCDAETMAPSRIQDDFRLELTLQAPPQREEDAVRDLVAWLRSLPVQDFTAAPGELEAFLDALRGEFQNLLSPPSGLPASPPGSPPLTLRIPRGQICEWMRAALRIWVTELRPTWQERWRARSASCACGCGGDTGCHGTGAEIPEQGRECLLLARVSLTRAAGAVTDATLNEDDRPFLVHLRMLQEVILCGRGRGLSLARTFGTAFTVDEQTIRVWLHYPEAVTVPAGAVTLLLNDIATSGVTVSPVQTNVYDLTLPASPPDSLAPGVTIEIQFDAGLILDPSGRDLAEVFASAWYRFNDYEEPTLRVYGYADTLPDIPMPNDALLKAENAFTNAAKPASPGISPDFARADHTHGVPPNPIPPHVASLTAHANHTVAGDVGGTIGATRLNRIQGKLVDAPAPANNQVLQFVTTTADPAGKWQARAITLPTVPTPNDGVLRPENAFQAAATAPAAGVSANFARADHTHGLPPNPIPPHVASLTAHANHQILGDVTQTIGATFIASLQNVPVDARAPQSEQVLQFDKARQVWMPKTLNLNGGGAANAVLRPAALDAYHIVAAGVLNIDRQVVVPSYNNLRFTGTTNRLLISFGPTSGTPAERYVQPTDDGSFTYIVKGHSKGRDLKRVAYLHVTEFLKTGIRVEFIPTANAEAIILEAMIEISFFGKF